MYLFPPSQQLRRAGHQALLPQTDSNRVVVGDITIDKAAHTVTLAGQLLELPPREFFTLALFAVATPPLP